MAQSSYETETIFVLKVKGKYRLFILLALPFTIIVQCLVFSFYFLTNLFSPNLKKIIKWFSLELKTSIRKALTGKFDVDQESITPAQFEKLSKGKSINHPLYGKCQLVETLEMNIVSGKIKNVKKKAS